VGVGKTVASLKLDNLDIEVRQFCRGNHDIGVLNTDEILQAGDRLVLMGAPESIEEAERRIASGRPKFSRL
jgi:Trk K+ transport system NAD-binding subunit